MFRIRANYNAPYIDLAGYKAALREALFEAVIQAARTWLSTATSIVPTWSGASQATFLQLAREVNYSLSISPRVMSRISLGMAHSSGEIEIDENKGRYFFTYKTDLPHLVYNEYNNANTHPDPTLFSKLIHPGPYHFQEQAGALAVAQLKSVKLPDVRRFIKTNRVK